MSIGNFGIGGDVGEIERVSNLGLYVFSFFMGFFASMVGIVFGSDLWIGRLLSAPYNFLLNFPFFQSSGMMGVTKIAIVPFFWGILTVVVVLLVFLLVQSLLD